MTNPDSENNFLHNLLQLLSQEGSGAFSKLLEVLLNKAMLLERSSVLEAKPYERTPTRKGYANGFKSKTLHTSLGSLCLDIPQVRGDIEFYPTALERYSRTDKALLLTMAEMYVQGVSTRKVDEVLFTLCGLHVSSSQVSRATAELEPHFHAWRNRPIGAQPYLVLDARFEKVRIDGSLRDCAVLIAIGISEDGHRSILGTSCALSDAEVHWRDFLESLQQRGLHGVGLIISDEHQGLRGAIKARFGSVPHQRCQFHLLQNAMDHVPKLALRPKVLEEMRAILHAPNKLTAQTLLRQMVETYSKPYPELAEWLESNLPESFAVFDLPPEHRVKMRTSNMIERVNQELKRRTRVIRVFPNIASLLRLITARLCEISDAWESGKIYLNMNTKSQSLAA